MAGSVSLGQGSDILWPRTESERETMNPRKLEPEGDSKNRRVSGGEEIILKGVWKLYGGETTDTFWGCGTGMRRMD